MENYITKAINKVKILFKNKNLAVNAMLNGLRVISNMIVPLISLPYLTRILQKENYGKFSFCNSIISYFVLISGLGISSYAIREGSRIREDNNELVSFSHEILGINIFSTLCAYVLLIITLLVWKPSSDYVKVIIALSPMIISGVLGFEWLPNVIEDFLYITVRGVIIQIISLICIFIFVKQPSDLVVYAVITGGALVNKNRTQISKNQNNKIVNYTPPPAKLDSRNCFGVR